jgi:hypothetical protein
MEAPIAGPLIRGASGEAAEGPLKADKERIRAVVRLSREAWRVNSAEPSSFTDPAIRAEQEDRKIAVSKRGSRGKQIFFLIPL